MVYREPCDFPLLSTHRELRCLRLRNGETPYLINESKIPRNSSERELGGGLYVFIYRLVNHKNMFAVFL